MRLVYQRVSSASVRVNGAVVGDIEKGVVILLGIGQNDTEADAELLAKKTAELRVFEDENGKMNLSLLDVDGDALVVSNFTLYGNCRHGRRPEFTSAARPDIAIPLYEHFTNALRALGVKRVQTGEFGADMALQIGGDGPVTILMDSEQLTGRKD